MGSRARQPCLRALNRERSFPAWDLGPVDRWALRRLISARVGGISAVAVMMGCPLRGMSIGWPAVGSGRLASSGSRRRKGGYLRPLTAIMGNFLTSRSTFLVFSIFLRSRAGHHRDGPGSGAASSQRMALVRPRAVMRPEFRPAHRWGAETPEEAHCNQETAASIDTGPRGEGGPGGSGGTRLPAESRRKRALSPCRLGLWKTAFLERAYTLFQTDEQPARILDLVIKKTTAR